jgi:hypothetical protein
MDFGVYDDSEIQRHARRLALAAAKRLWRGGPPRSALPHHSALTLWTVQVVGMFPTPADDETVTPFMNHIAVLPAVSRQRRSLMPSPLSSPTSAIDHVVGILPRLPADDTAARDKLLMV